MLRSPGIEGWAERRETFGCVRSTRWACHLASKTRVNALMTRHARRLRGALRPMTQQYMGRNNVTISMPDGGSVPIVSQTEIDPMKIALSLMLAPRHDDGAHRAAARAEAARARAARARTPTSRAAHSARRHWVLRTPSPSRATALARGDGLRRAPTACEMAAPGSSFALLRFLLSRPCRAARVAAASSSHRFARGGDEQEGAWPRARLERMNALFVARLECTIATGSESASAAQATVVDPTSRMR